MPRLRQQQHLLETMQQQINTLSHSIAAPSLSREEIVRLVEEHYAQRSPENQGVIQQRIAQLEKRIQDLQVKAQELHPPVQTPDFSVVLSRIAELQEKLTEKKLQKEFSKERPEHISHLKQKVIQKIQRNSKTHVKSFILGLIEKYEKASGLQLREMVVDEQRLCSKSSFYRLLQELEDDQKIKVIQEGKEKLYFARSQHAIVDK